MILVYNIFSVALLGAKLASLKWPEPLEIPTRPQEELQKKYCTLKSITFNFQEDRQRWSPSKPSFGSALLAPGLAVGRRLRGALRQLRTRWRLPAAPLSAKMAATSGASCPSTATLCHGFT